MAITRSRRVLLASGIGAVLGLTACSAGTSPSAIGGGLPPPVAVTLTLGVPDSPGFPPEFQDIAYFYDSPANDTFVGYSRYSSMISTFGTFAENDIAAYFTRVYAYSFVGSTDYAYLYDAGVNHESGFVRVV